MNRQFEIVTDPETGIVGIRCLTCGLTSYNPNDVDQQYCGYCARFLAAKSRTAPPGGPATNARIAKMDVDNALVNAVLFLLEPEPHSRHSRPEAAAALHHALKSAWDTYRGFGWGQKCAERETAKNNADTPPTDPPPCRNL